MVPGFIEAIEMMEVFCMSCKDSIQIWWNTYFVPNWVDDDWPLLWSDIRRHAIGMIFLSTVFEYIHTVIIRCLPTNRIVAYQ